jgi:peptidoglycan/LPS O-acetylase OafA/YrhL
MTDNVHQKEIDGLRAISVLVIIFFHFELKAFLGGFIGVDVFFYKAI